MHKATMPNTIFQTLNLILLSIHLSLIIVNFFLTNPHIAW